MSRFPRMLPLVAVLLGVAALVTPMTLARAAAPVPQQVAAGTDFATTTWADPWDYSNSEDILLDNGPAAHLSRPSVSGGLLNFVLGSAGYISPLWAGYPGSLRLGRDGAAPSNMINGTVYNRFNLHAYASAPVSAMLAWFTCDAPVRSCMGAMPFSLSAGWNDIDGAIANSSRLLSDGKPWGARMQGLRLALTPRPSATVRIDALRVYRQDTASVLNWSSPDSTSARLWWTDAASGITTTPGQHAGMVRGPASTSSRAMIGTNVSGYPPGTRFWAVSSTHAATYVGLTAPAPRPVVDSPSAGGCTTYLGRPWTFTSPRSLAGYGNATAMSFSTSGILTATNGGAHRNDPYIYLPIGSGGIDGRVYHRLTIVESYNGAFNLADVPGGGTMGRIVWLSAGHTVVAQTNDILTYSGKRSITLDLAMPASVLTEPSGSAAQRYAFASTARVLKLRWDPNEDPGARRWHVYSIRLAADCATHTTFGVTWHDAAFTAGGTARIEARSLTGSTVITLGRVTEFSGTNRFVMRAASLPPGRYQLRVYVTNRAGITAGAAGGGPLIVTH